MNNRNDIVIKNDLMISDNIDIQDILNNHVPIEKIYKDIYCSITKRDLEDFDISIHKYSEFNSVVMNIYKGSKSIKTIIDDNKYHIILVKDNKIICVFKINNLNNKMIEFLKMNDGCGMGISFDPELFYYNNSFIINIKYKKGNNKRIDGK